MTPGFAERGANAACVPMQVPEPDLAPVLAGLARVPNVGGLLVTMPHKTAAFAHCATTAERARRLGVVSVMRRNPDAFWHGDTLDGLAFLKAQTDAGARPEGARVLLLGAAGAGSAIAIALLEAGVRELVVHDPSESRLARLLALLAEIAPGRARAGTPDPVGCDMVCSATSLGMADGDPLPVAADLLAPSMFFGDVIAGHGLTPFLHTAEAAGCRTADGDAMVDCGQVLMVDFFLRP